jgi:hypothetical protein
VKPSSRWLLAFGAAIGLLAIVAIVLVLIVGAREAPLLPENTPEGIVQRYFLALKDGDYVTAYNYLSPKATEKYPYGQWVPFVSSEERPGFKVTLGKSAVTGNEATVDVVVNVFRPGGPFENPVRTQYVTFFLKKEGTSWKITSPWDVWWLFY